MFSLYLLLYVGYIGDIGLYMGLYMKFICMELCIIISSKLCLRYIGYSSMLHRL